MKKTVAELLRGAARSDDLYVESWATDCSRGQKEHRDARVALVGRAVALDLDPELLDGAWQHPDRWVLLMDARQSPHYLRKETG